MGLALHVMGWVRAGLSIRIAKSGIVIMIERYVATGSLPKRRPKPIGAATGRVTSKEPAFEDVAPKANNQRSDEIKRLRLEAVPEDAVHLHWLWRQGPAALRNVMAAVGACGKISIPRSHVTSFLDDTTCPICKRIAS